MTEIASIDPRTGTPVEVVAEETGAQELDALCRAAGEAAAPFAAAGRQWRAGLLRRIAAELEADREAIVELADRETALGPTRLNGELTRTCYQFELFAQAVEEGSYTEAVIDHAGDTPMGPRPDLRRMLLPLGPVAVFGASNFPLAFSVPGGDTAAALAAGCPVVIKAHPAHPATSLRTFAALERAAAAEGAPKGVLALVHGVRAGADLVAHPAIRAVGFTGSLRGGRALFDIASSRPDPIPFYGELGSVNPLVVAPAAASARGEEIAQGITGSFTLGAGQFCTKPGLVFLPEDEAGTSVADAMAQAVGGLAPGVLLSEQVRGGYEEGTRRLAGSAAVRSLAEGTAPEGTGWGAAVRLLATSAADLTAETAEECFGPATLVVTYRDRDELAEALERVPGSLTATLIADDADAEFTAALEPVLRDRAGRIVYNGYPTGVAVAWGQHHGGPWPATTSALHTSVGITSIRRFLRPMTWQNAPQELLPDELRDTPEHPLPRRVDGTLRV
ncbi:aldehyde dehydrogenase (NADP(+)) [Streptomonospora nanhaiensis]|uniref:NADP-dependent aldehyde dehydrogenase n=1 Tax=Streptomonospora nanhaiensis TaxID=1323731 RepID=A0A853BRE0_9ACTN|nr:aldehyde dehydrogenase (NADP(+)) [Streptomonospora nanhaiensis]MBV2362241.1 aldehyde dehydrogenase (NADP(+)) [Streptomonospora nanhaiensis]MBX9387833.1 aldehyde dehydrogenase (NADP(+)) [Streptomonospora nanhaiensis]NYI97305.1 NADP-dependent aldehyde dehydrogenase [Streptomonospora nanhaiensis]